MTYPGAPTAHAGAGGPRPTAMPQNDRSEKRDLASWWKSFKTRDRHQKVEVQQVPTGIFGVPLQDSIRYANVAISLLNEEGQSYIYGYVPIVVAKCGVYLKEKATDVEGIFRLAGSEKRIKELKVAFDSPDRYGKGLDWTGYTVHDAANILRRYFNQLPEPIIPLEFYEPFRDPLKNHQEQAVGALDSQSPSVGDFDQDGAIRKYQRLITELPPLNRQLLLYILDLLAVFDSKSDLNKMTTANLAAIFQPGILSHPQHDMAPQEYRLSQDVLIFLIENQDSFLIGMQGTGADPETIRDVQSGGLTPPKGAGSPGTPTRAKPAVDRSSSNASAGAESIRRWGSLRRNVSVSSSKHSKRSEGGPVPVGAPITPTTSSGVNRSNTVPSRRGGSNSTQSSPRFSRDPKSVESPPIPGMVAAAATIVAATESEKFVEAGKVPEPEPVKAAERSIQTTPVVSAAPQFASTNTAQPEIISPSTSESTTPLANVRDETAVSMARDDKDDVQTPKQDTMPLLATPDNHDRVERPAVHTPSATSSRGFLDIFKQSPGSDTEGQRKPNKLQKKRVPSSTLSSAHSSSHDLAETSQQDARSPAVPAAAAATSTATPAPEQPNFVSSAVLSTPPRDAFITQQRPTSPSNSYHSTTEDVSEAEFAGDDMPRDTTTTPEKIKRRHRWRFSRSQNKMDATSPPRGDGVIGDHRELTTSRSTVGSTGAAPRRSFQEVQNSRVSVPATETSIGNSISPGTFASTSTPATTATDRSNTTTSDPAVFSDSERERRAGSGPMQWIRGKISTHKEKDAQKEKEKETNRERDAEKRASRPTLAVDRSDSRDDVLAAQLSEQPAASSVAVQPPATQEAPAAPTTNGNSTTAPNVEKGPVTPGLERAKFVEQA